jgi:hypothetical protein
MSMYYNPELVRLLTEERLREARQSNGIYCCMEPMAEKPRPSVRGPFRRMFSRQSPATCSC